MASLRTLVEQRREDIKATVGRHHGRRVLLFGSVARGREHADIDIDIDLLADIDIDLLVDFGPESSLFDLLHLSQDLEELLGHPVDIVSRGGLKDRDRAILDEAIEL